MILTQEKSDEQLFKVDFDASNNSVIIYKVRHCPLRRMLILSGEV